MSALLAPLVQTFCPETVHPPSSGDATVWTWARSDPASGSEKSWHHISRPVRIASRCRCCWSMLPYSMSMGPTRSGPTILSWRGTRALAISSAKTACSSAEAPRPPYSFGHDRQAHRPSASRCCHRRPSATSATVGVAP